MLKASTARVGAVIRSLADRRSTSSALISGLFALDLLGCQEEEPMKQWNQWQPEVWQRWHCLSKAVRAASCP
ncbi:hypothetical protein GcM1_250005 [Golovinomyces cichoracearum]|uniref:Uncharacterized protein n=1 Tax=Golovinomyces cichoracearum TaxID=62708 RepID=A0A420IAK5_9PEZI|nr:hypothetical protein GcM1_250005 [Golovinomyces cichoracearum]